MKALSIKNPMGILIALGIKHIENRTKRTHFKGKIYIHVSAKYMETDFLEAYIDNDRLKDMHVKLRESGRLGDDERIADFLQKQPLSAIIGEVEIIDSVVNHPSIWADKTEIIGKTVDGEPLYKDKPIWNWVLANAKLYEKPILNVKGKLSFWEPDIDLQKCESCEEPTDSETMYCDDDSNWFCPECWKQLAPVMAAEYKELKEKGEIN